MVGIKLYRGRYWDNSIFDAISFSVSSVPSAFTCFNETFGCDWRVKEEEICHTFVMKWSRHLWWSSHRFTDVLDMRHRFTDREYDENRGSASSNKSLLCPVPCPCKISTAGISKYAYHPPFHRQREGFRHTDTFCALSVRKTWLLR